jgi:hypothetical protein
MVKFPFTTGLLSLLAGCVVSVAKDPIPTGRGTYIVTAVGPMTGDPMSAAMKRANKFCADSGRVTTMLETTPLRQSGVGPIYVSVQFTCTDIEHQQPVQLRPDAGISTSESK